MMRSATEPYVGLYAHSVAPLGIKTARVQATQCGVFTPIVGTLNNVQFGTFFSLSGQRSPVGSLLNQYLEVLYGSVPKGPDTLLY